MTMSQMDSDNVGPPGSGEPNTSQRRRTEYFNIADFIESTQQVDTTTAKSPPRQLSNAESDIIKTIHTCLRNWYGPWRRTYLAAGEEFKATYDLMENLMHYEYQITNSETIMPSDRLNAIAQAVARLVDYGNAILNLDIIIRASDETSKELDPSTMTTIELYQAHIKAQKLREKLLYNYFKKDKKNMLMTSPTDTSTNDNMLTNVVITNNHPHQSSNNNTIDYPTLLQVPYHTHSRSNSNLSASSPTMNRSNRLSVGSNVSINNLPSHENGNSGRRTPQSSPHIEMIMSQQPPYGGTSTNDLTSSQLEMRHMMATVKSSAFTSIQNSSTRLALLPGVLGKIEQLMTVPTNAEKLTNCFDLMNVLFHTMEKLPIESRREEVAMVAISLLKLIVRKVYIDNRDNCVEFQHSHWTTYLLSMIRLMTATDFHSYLKHFSNLTDLGAFLKDYLFIIKRLVSSSRRQHSHQANRSLSVQTSYPNHIISTANTNGTNSITPITTTVINYNNHMHSSASAAMGDGYHIDSMNDSMPSIYPECWIEMSLLVCSTFLTSLIYLYQILRQHFGSNSQMWTSFIDCLVHFILQDSLEPNRCMFKERQSLLANDLRKTSAEYVWITWDSLNYEQKQLVIEDLVEPLLRASLTLDSGQRAILLPIFYDMMRCDYTSQYITPRGSMCTSSGTLDNQSQSVMRLESQLNHFIYEEDFENSSQMKLSPPPPSEFASTTTSTNQDLNNIIANNNHHNHAGPSRAVAEESLPYLSFRDNSSSEDGTVLTKFTHLIVEKLNYLMIDLGMGDEQFRQEFCGAISGELNPKYYNNQMAGLFMGSMDFDQFRSMARHTSDLIAEFVQICLDSRQAERLSYNHLHLLCLFKLILFFRDKVDRTELYLANLHKLWLLHHQSGRYVEAGFTLLEHAKSMAWSDRPLESHYRIITRSFHVQEPPLSTYTSLKVFLYTTIVEYFDQGQLWEAAVPLCRELIDLYQFRTYEYSKLAPIYSRLAHYFGRISDINSRTYPEYFRVTFYGCGFPKCLQNVTMIYRGRPYEKLGDFQAILLSKYPDAKLLTTLAKPDESLLSSSSKGDDNKYLQINACSPIVDLKGKFPGKQAADLNKIETTILDYFKHNECDRFEFSRRISLPQSGGGGGGGDDNFANMWRERTILTTNSLPGMLPFYTVYLSETTIVSPIESAIEDLERVNDRLSCMVNRFKADKRQEEDVRLLGQLLLGVVDAAVNGGITKYEQAFFDNTNTHRNNPQAVTSSSSSSSSCPLGTTTTSSAQVDNSTATQQQQQSSSSSSSAAAAASFALVQNNFVNLTVSTEPITNNKQSTTTTNNNNDYTCQQQQPQQPSATQLAKLKCLIAQQVPLLDEAIRLHKARVADIMRPQHEHLEASYKKLKHHIMTKYSRYLPAEYNHRSQSMRSYRSLARSPNRSIRSDSRLSTPVGATTNTQSASTPSPKSLTAAPPMASGASTPGGRFKRNSDAGSGIYAYPDQSKLNNNHEATGSGSPLPSPGNLKKDSTSIPYKQLASQNERRSLPFLTGVSGLDRHIIKESMLATSPSSTSSGNNDIIGADDDDEADAEDHDDELSDIEASLMPPPPPIPAARVRSSSTTKANYGQFNSNSEYVCVSDLMRGPPPPPPPPPAPLAAPVREETPYERLLPDKNNQDKSGEEEEEDDDDDRESSLAVHHNLSRQFKQNASDENQLVSL